MPQRVLYSVSHRLLESNDNCDVQAVGIRGRTELRLFRLKGLVKTRKNHCRKVDSLAQIPTGHLPRPSPIMREPVLSVETYEN